MDTEKMKHVSWFVLPPVQEWYFRSRNPEYRVLPELQPECQETGDVDFIELIYPRHSARVYAPREFDGTRGKIILEAAHRKPSSRIHWHLDGEYLGSTRHLHQMGITPDKGNHTLTLVDGYGHILEHNFEVVER